MRIGYFLSCEEYTPAQLIEQARLAAATSAVPHDGRFVLGVGTGEALNASYGSFCSFTDPDGNLWVVQEVTTRLPGRVD
jgi:hypothetical protein